MWSVCVKLCVRRGVCGVLEVNVNNQQRTVVGVDVGVSVSVSVEMYGYIGFCVLMDVWCLLASHCGPTSTHTHYKIFELCQN